jgi:nitrate reductase beta subunit
MYQNGKVIPNYQKIPRQNGSKILQITKKCTNNSTPRASQIYPNFEFGYDNEPSGNPDGFEP